MDIQEKTFKNPIEEQRKAALEHYEQASRAANHWSSFVESAIKAYNPESCPPPVSAEVVSQLFLYDNISPDFIPIDNLEEAKKYVEANYTEDDGIHPDFHSFPIYKKVGSVDADINGEDICTSITVSSSSPSAPVVAEQVHKKSLAALDKLIKDQPELIEKINKELDNFGFEGPTISEYFASFGHSPAERREGDAVEAKSNIDFVERYNELRKEFNIVDALRKLQIESSTPPQEGEAKAIAEAAFNAGVDWRNGIITYGAVTNPFPDKEQYLSKFK